MSEGWVKACDAGEIEPEDVLRFDYEDRTFAFTGQRTINFMPRKASVLTAEFISPTVS